MMSLISWLSRAVPLADPMGSGTEPLVLSLAALGLIVLIALAWALMASLVDKFSEFHGGR